MNVRSGLAVDINGGSRSTIDRWGENDRSDITATGLPFHDQNRLKTKTPELEVLKPIPPGELETVQNKQRGWGFLSIFKSYTFIVFGFIVLAAVVGYNFPGRISISPNQELVTKGSYVLDRDFIQLIQNDYVVKQKFDSIHDENTQLQLVVQVLGAKSHPQTMTQLSGLLMRRNTLVAILDSIQSRNLSFPLKSGESENLGSANRNEQNILKRIEDLTANIQILYNELKL